MKERREDASKTDDAHDSPGADRAPPDATRAAMADWSSDQAGDRVGAGPGHGAAHRAAMGAWSFEAGGTLAAGDTVATPAGLFEKVTASPGAPLVTVKVEVSLLPPELAAILGVPATAQVDASVTVVDETLAVVVSAGSEVLVAKVDLAKVLHVLAGPAGAELAALLPKVQDFVASAAGRFSAASGTHVKIHLWGDAKDESFVVIDLAKALRGAWNGSAAGLRPIEARLATKAGRVEQFGGDLVTAQTALPDDKDALGSLDVVAPALRKDVLGLDDAAPVHGTVYYRKGKLAVAIKPDAAATTGVVAEIDLAYLANKLRALGQKIADLIEQFLPKFESGDRDWLKWDLGSLKFNLGGLNFFSFDFGALLPKLGGGGGFDLSGLWPSSWHFDLPKLGLGLGTMPKLDFAWAGWPTLGSFPVDLGRLKGLFSGFGLPELPKLGSIDFDLHFKKLQFGLGLDLSKLWPDLGLGDRGPTTFGFDLDLSAILDALAKAGGAIGKAAQWLLAKLRAAGDAIKTWIHLGDDGVIRIYNGAASDASKTSMLGFSLLRLLDGVQGTDLAPVEVRYHGDDATLELGQAVEPGAEAAADARKERPEGAAAPQKPASPIAEQQGVELPESAITTLGLAPGAKGYVAIAGEYPDLIAYASAPSGHRDGDEALRLSVDVESLGAMLQKKLPAPRGGKVAKPHLGGIKIGDDSAIEVRLGEKAEAGEAPTPFARAAWRVGKILAKDFRPDQLEVTAGGHGVTLGPFTEPGGLLGDRFDLKAPGVRKDVLGVADGKPEVWLGAYYDDDIFALTATAEKDKHEGLLGHVNVVQLLEQLKRLGAFGEKILDAIGTALGAGVDKLKGFGAKLAAIAAKIGRGLMKIVNGVLQLKLPEIDGGGGGWIGWDLRLLAPNISLQGFSLEGLIPDFSNLRLPGLPGVSLSWLPSVPLSFDPDFSLGKIPDLSFGKLKSLFKGLDLPDVTFGFEAFGLDDFHLGISLDLSALRGLSDLFPEGHNLSFDLDLKRILGPLEKAWAWLKSKFPKGKPRKDSGVHVKLGGDGVLRMWDDKAHIGFALTNLLDGFQPADVVPVEMSFEVTTGKGDPLAELQYGQVVDDKHKAPAKPEEGQVLAQRPKGKTMAEAKFDAPEPMRQHLGAPKGADLDVDLIAVDDDTAALFATVTGTDRGMVLQVETAAIQKLVRNLGPKAPSDLGGVKILWDECRKHKSIVIGFGEQPGAKTKPQDVKTHGHARWKISRFFDGLELGDLVPDEAHLGMAQGGLSIGEIDTKGLKSVTTIDVPDEPSWIKSGLGGIEKAQVFANQDEKALRVALVAAGGDPKAPKQGVELDVAAWFVDKIEEQVTEAAKKAGKAVTTALRKTAGAGKRLGGDLSDKRIGLESTPAGLRLQRGKDGDADHTYATFGWAGIVDAVTRGQYEGLMPTELRFATSAVALEIEEAKSPEGGMPKDAKRVGGMHDLFKGALTAFGLKESQFLDLDLGKSPIEELPDGGHNVNLVGMIYTPEGKPPETDHAPGIEVSDAQKVTLSVSLEALLAQVLPKKRAFTNQKKNKGVKDGGTSMDLGFQKDLVPEETGDQAGIGLSVSSTHTRKGKTRTIKIEAGWTAEKLLEILMNLDDLVGPQADAGSATGLLTPDVLRGSFENHLFDLAIANRGEAVGTAIECGDLPLVPELLGTFVDTETANQTKLHVEVPDGPTLAKNFGSALLSGEKVMLGRAAIEMPKAPHLYSVTLKLSMGFLERLAGFIPYVGLAIKIIRGVQGFVTDPKGTAESLLYTPEMLYHFVDNAGAIYDKLSNMSAKDIALAFMSNDASTKQAVYAARLKKRLEKAGVKLPDGKPGGVMPSEAELAWLNKQDPKAIEKAVALEARLAEMGIYPDESEPDPSAKLDLAEIETFQAAVEQGFTEFAEAKKAADAKPGDAAAAQRSADAAEKFRKQVAAHLAAGAKKMERERERTTDGKPVPEGERQDVPEDEKLTRVDELPEPDPDRLAEAQAMFKETQEGLDPTREAYLIQKFSILTTAQLAELLENNTVQVTGKNGPMQLPLWESERPFALQLFIVRIRKEGMELDKNPDLSKPGATAQQIVAAWRNRAAKAGDQAKKDARKAAKDKAAEDQAARDAARGVKPKPGAGGGKEEGEGEGEGDGGSLDDSLWGDEPEETTGSGDTGAGLDKDGDGKLTKDELRGPEPEPDAGGGNGEPAPEATIDDTQLWTPTVNDAHVWMKWDAGRGALVRDEAKIKEIIGLQTPASNGETATLTAIETQVGGDVGRGHKVIEFSIVLVAKTKSGELRSRAFVFYHDVKKNAVFEASGASAMKAAVLQTFAIKDGKAVLRGDGAFDVGNRHLKVKSINDTQDAGKGVFLITATMLAVDVPADTKIRNSAYEWQIINNGDSLDMKLPYVDPAGGGSDSGSE